MLPYYQGGYLPTDSQQQQQQQQQQLDQSNKSHQLDTSSLSQEAIDHDKPSEHQTHYPPYVLMQDHTYPEFTYDSSLINDSTLTPLPETGYIRRQEDVFSELISLANHRQHISPLIPQTAASSSYPYPSTTATGTTPLTVRSGSPLSELSWNHPIQDRQYELKVVQQPYRARMCGFGDKDRRPISPPPILQMVTKTKDGQTIKPE
jgi:hypothetical protein